jgi:hypothetical protein
MYHADIEVEGTPGNVVAIYQKPPVDGPFLGLPTRLLAWGVFDETGKWTGSVVSKYPDVETHTYDPELREHFEKNEHVNTE